MVLVMCTSHEQQCGVSCISTSEIKDCRHRHYESTKTREFVNVRLHVYKCLRRYTSPNLEQGILLYRCLFVCTSDDLIRPMHKPWRRIWNGEPCDLCCSKRSAVDRAAICTSGHSHRSCPVPLCDHPASRRVRVPPPRTMKFVTLVGRYQVRTITNSIPLEGPIQASRI